MYINTLSLQVSKERLQTWLNKCVQVPELIYKMHRNIQHTTQ